MSITSIVAGIALTLISWAASASTVFGFIRETPVAATPKEYLSGDSFHMGYVTIKATVEGVTEAGCISPAFANLWRLLFSEESEVFLAAQIWGFKGVDSGKWIPIATYSWNNNKQLCTSVFQPAVVLVPLTPIVPSTDIAVPGPIGEPYLRLAIRYQSTRNEKVTSAFKTALQISSTYATGGAASTLTQLLDIAGGPAAKLVSDQFQALFSSAGNQDQTLPLKWSEIKGDGQEYRLKLASIEKSADETVQTALERMDRSPATATPLGRLKISINTRRSIFFADSVATTSPQFSLPSDDPSVSRYAILNFPEGTSAGKSGAISSIQQLLSSEAPALSKELTAATYPLACQKLSAKLNSAGFNRHDSALITAAILDEVRGPNWRSDSEFISSCILDAKLHQAIAQLRPPINPIPTLTKDVELPSNPESFVTIAHQNFLVGLRNALISNGLSKTILIESALQKLPDSAIWGADIEKLPSDAKISASAKGAQLPAELQRLPVYAAGCFVSYTVDGYPHIGMALVVNSIDGVRRPYLLTIKLDNSKILEVPTSAAVKNIWLLDLELATPQANAFVVSSYAKSGMCYTPEPRDNASVIKKLSTF